MDKATVYYEVDVEVDEAIFDEYLPWLEAHVQKILAIPGFQRANLSEKKTLKPGRRNVVVVYELRSMDCLNRYIEDHAVKLREEAIERFGEKIKIMRRIFPEREKQS